MRKIIPFLFVIIIFASCKKEIVKTPDHLIEKNKMINILYDLSILEGIKMSNPSSLDTFKINANNYIYKKYTIDSIQFVQNNTYYASDYKEYKLMYETIKSRIEKNKSLMDSIVKIENKKILAQKAAKEKLKAKKVADSIKKVKDAIKIKKVADSIKKIKVAKTLDSIKTAKKKKKAL